MQICYFLLQIFQPEKTNKFNFFITLKKEKLLVLLINTSKRLRQYEIIWRIYTQV